MDLMNSFTQRFLVAAAVVAACLCAGRSNAAPTGVAGGPLQVAITAIRKEELNLQNITVHARYRYWGQLMSPWGAVAWVPRAHPANDMHLWITMDGLPHGCFLAKVPKFLTLGHVRQPKQAYDERFEAAYDGTVGTYLEDWLFVPGHSWEHLNSGKVYGKMPPIRGTLDRASGWCWTTFGFTGQLRYHFHPLFSRYITPGARQTQISAKVVQWHGNSYLRVDRYGPPTGRTVFLLDPRHGYAMAEYKFYSFHATKEASGKYKFGPGTVAWYTVQADGFWRCPHDICYPKLLRFVQTWPPPARIPSPHPKIDDLAEVKVLKVAINRPGITRASYVVQFPAGAQVHDMATGRYIRIVGTAKQQLSVIEGAVKAARDQPHATGAAGGGK